jgi:hypothetical protein
MADPAIESRVHLPGPAASPPGRNARRRARMEQIPGTRRSSQRLFRSILRSRHIASGAAHILQDFRGPSALSGLAPDAFDSCVAPPLRQSRPCSPVPQAERLYVTRNVAALERAFPGLTPQRGMETNDRAAYEASLAFPALRRLSGASPEAIVREGLAPAPSARTKGHREWRPDGRGAGARRSRKGLAAFERGCGRIGLLSSVHADR